MKESKKKIMDQNNFDDREAKKKKNSKARRGVSVGVWLNVRIFFSSLELFQFEGSTFVFRADINKKKLIVS